MATDDPSAPRGRLRRARLWLLRYAACVAVAGVLGLPVAAGWAVTHTVVEEMVGTTPTRFTLSTQGQSELRLGIAGTVYVPRSVGPFGVVATVDGPGDPGAGDGDLANYVSPEMVRLYAGIFHDPGPALDQYVGLVRADLRGQLVGAVVVVSLGGGLVLLALLHLVPLRPVRSRRDRVRVVLAGALALAVTTSVGALEVVGSDGHRAGSGVYPLEVLDGTLATGATTDSPLIRALTGGALTQAQSLIARQEEAEAAYRASAEADLEAQTVLMSAPRENETAVLVQSDMHCNTTMIRMQKTVVDLLRERFGDDVPAMMASAGDLTTNGTAAEGPCIEAQRAIVGEAPVAAVTGNHESELSAEQMADAGMTVLGGSIEEVGGIRFLGDGDPSRSELFGGTRLRGDESQADVGSRLREEALDADPEDRPEVVLVHEGYAAEAFLGVDSVRDLVGDGGADGGADGGDRSDDPVSTTQAPPGGADGIDDVPAGAVFYGHWHRSVDPRVIWNSDGTWTLLMELDTSGGAIATPTINSFSTPWSKPQQAASFPVVFLDRETGLVTGYQLYRFEPDGAVVVEPRVPVGTTSEAPDEASPEEPDAAPEPDRTRDR